MQTVEFYTVAEAEAFIAGIEYVNDSAISNINYEFDKIKYMWIVTFDDKDQRRGYD